MRIPLLGILSAYLLFGAVPALAETGSEIDVLRTALQQMRADYETRIADLERRLDEAESRSAAQQPAVSQTSAPATAPAEPMRSPATSTRPSGSGSGLFNPDLGVIFQGRAWSYGNDPHEYEIPGFPMGGETELPSEGMSLGETEINISANVDDKFTARLTAPLHIHHGHTEIEIEEAWIETLKMPAGLSLRMGRFFSNIGYLNSKHAHNWDFADQPLPYKAFLGNQYIDDGLQVRWLAPTDIYFELGAEFTRGGRYPAGDHGDAGIGSYTIHALLGGDVGFSHSWQAGLSYLQANADERASGHEDEAAFFTGDNELLMAEFVWKWAPNGNWKQKNFVLQSEFLWRRGDGEYTLDNVSTLPYDSRQNGWYAQAVYQPFPRWRFGMRYDRLSSDNPGSAYIDTPLMPGSDNPWRYSLMADWSNSEFSRLRLQYTLDEAGFEGDNLWGLQYIFSIGAHGAHTF